MPLDRLPFRSTVVASQNDPAVSFARAYLESPQTALMYRLRQFSLLLLDRRQRNLMYSADEHHDRDRNESCPDCNGQRVREELELAVQRRMADPQ